MISGLRLFALVGLFGFSVGAVSAAPIAQYFPGTGGINFSGLSNIDNVYLTSAESPLILANAVGPNPHHVFDDHRIAWTGSPLLPEPEFFGGNVVPLGHPANKLIFEYHVRGVRPFSEQGQIVVIPEPSGFFVSASGILWLALVWHRRQPA